VYILRNAIMNLGRNRGRNILLGIIILVITGSAAVSLVIHSTTGSIIREYKNRFGSRVSIAPDMDKLFSGGARPDPISYAQYLEFGKSSCLMDSFFRNELPATGEGVKAVNEDSEKSGGLKQVMGGDGGTGEMVMPTMKLLGFSRADGIEEFRDGMRKVVDGKLFEKKGECIVSQEFAKLNGVRPGSFIRIKNAMESSLPAARLTVSGIYADATDEYGGAPFRGAFMNRRNEILTSFETVASMSSIGGVNVVANYYLKNPELLPVFEKELRAGGLSDDYIVSTDKASYNKVVGPVESLSRISFIFLLVVLLPGSLILMFLSALSIRERKYEIGVLRAMGMKKRKVALGLILEMLMITVLSLCIGLAAGASAAQPIADSMLKGQIAAAEQAKENQTFGNLVMIGGEQSSLSPVSQLKTSLNPGVILQITAIALLLAVLACISGISRINQYEPIKLLTDRN